MDKDYKFYGCGYAELAWCFADELGIDFADFKDVGGGFILLTDEQAEKLENDLKSLLAYKSTYYGVYTGEVEKVREFMDALCRAGSECGHHMLPLWDGLRKITDDSAFLLAVSTCVPLLYF